MAKLTVVFLHVGPKVSLFYTVSKCAIPNVLTLLASCHMHANLQPSETHFVNFPGRSLKATAGCQHVERSPQIEMGWVFWLEVILLLSTFSFHGNLQAQLVCLLPT